jgi:hypothetical protein
MANIIQERKRNRVIWWSGDLVIGKIAVIRAIAEIREAKP